MKNITSHLLLLLLLVSLASSCEQTLPFVDEIPQSSSIVINALASADTLFTVTVSSARSLDRMPYVSSDEFWERDVVDTASVHIPDYMCYDDAVVAATVNGTRRVSFRYDGVSRSYLSDYVPKEGDRISVEVSREEDGQTETAHAETTVPRRPSIEVLDHVILYDTEDSPAEGDFWDGVSETNDTRYMEVTCRIHDLPGSHYYRLLVRVVAQTDQDRFQPKGFYKADIFHSDDPLFVDNRLGKSYGGWPAYFSNVFDDHLFEGQSYTFSVSSSRLRQYGVNQKVCVELQEISSDLYYYLKSVQVYRITEQDDFVESIQIHSNVENGWGILGSLSGIRIVVPFE